jgi:hypothetical protein
MLDKLREWGLAWYKKSRATVLGLSNRRAMREIRRELETLLREEAARSGGGQLPDPERLTGEDRALYDRIRERTVQQNRNNVTRTAAYLDVYLRTPELHWALLAHMVSRNGGYSMTDLKGDPVSWTLESGEAEKFFQFLERANWLIFGDAYPQLLLYEESRVAGKPLFHLLPYFGISCFMGPIWRRFWETGNSQELTMALVINEQNYIEGRVVREPVYKAVVESFEFQAQTYLNLTQVTFPFVPKEPRSDLPPLHLAGTTVDSFLSLSERIDTGRNLYAILFRIPEVLAGVVEWVKNTPHTASRTDYWPHLYTTNRKIFKTKRYHPRVDGCKLRRRADPLYSPPLTYAWGDVKNPEPPGRRDWCVSAEAAEELYFAKHGAGWNVTLTVCKTLMMVEKAVAAETWLDGGRRPRP